MKYTKLAAYNVCEHGSLKRKCPHCEYAEEEREYLVKIADQAARIEQLENGVQRIADRAYGPDLDKAYHMGSIARALLKGGSDV